MQDLNEIDVILLRNGFVFALASASKTFVVESELTKTIKHFTSRAL